MSGRKEREPEKRKSGKNDAVGGAQKKPREDNGGETSVKDDEVEEFFAILGRLHVAVNYFKKSNGGNRKLTGEGSLALELESNNNHAAGDDGVKGTGDVKENVGFDLNAEPDEDPDLNPGSA